MLDAFASATICKKKLCVFFLFFFFTTVFVSTKQKTQTVHRHTHMVTQLSVPIPSNCFPLHGELGSLKCDGIGTSSIFSKHNQQNAVLQRIHFSFFFCVCVFVFFFFFYKKWYFLSHTKNKLRFCGEKKRRKKKPKCDTFIWLHPDSFSIGDWHPGHNLLVSDMTSLLNLVSLNVRWS